MHKATVVVLLVFTHELLYLQEQRYFMYIHGPSHRYSKEGEQNVRRVVFRIPVPVRAHQKPHRSNFERSIWLVPHNAHVAATNSRPSPGKATVEAIDPPLILVLKASQLNAKMLILQLAVSHPQGS